MRLEYWQNRPRAQQKKLPILCKIIQGANNVGLKPEKEIQGNTYI
jgi:hypothetical protein